MREFLEPHAVKEATTYTFTKNIAELLVKMTSEEIGFSAGIIRPPVLFSPVKEPSPAFTDDSRQGVVALCLSIYIGLTKVITYDGSQRFVYNVVDVIANAIIAMGWDIGMRDKKEVVVYNSCKVGDTFDDMIVMVVNAANNSPSVHTLRPLKPFKCTKNNVRSKVRKYFKHNLFAHLGDMAIKVTGHKPM